MPLHVSSSVFPCSAAALRRFLGQPANLPQVSDPDIELEIIRAPDEVEEGQLIEFRISAFGLKQRATHRYAVVTETEICEVMTDGILRAWKHRQQFESLGDHECRLTDEIEFEPPGGMAGFLMNEAKIRDSIQNGMTERYAAINELVSRKVIS